MRLVGACADANRWQDARGSESELFTVRLGSECPGDWRMMCSEDETLGTRVCLLLFAFLDGLAVGAITLAGGVAGLFAVAFFGRLLSVAGSVDLVHVVAAKLL